MNNKENISQLLIESAELLNEGIFSKIEEKRAAGMFKILDEIKSIIDKNEYKDYFIHIQELLEVGNIHQYTDISLIGLDVERDRSNKQDFSNHLYVGKTHKLYTKNKVHYTYEELVKAIKGKYKIGKYL